MDQKLVDLAKNLKANGSTQDEVLRELRKVSSSMIDAIAAIRFAYGVGLGQAKDIVALSPHWNSIHQAHNGLHDTLEKIAKQSNGDSSEQKCKTLRK